MALISVRDTFTQAVNIFNAQTWPALGPYLHQDVVVYNINQNKAAVGHAAAMTYFQNLGFRDQFVPHPVQRWWPPNLPPNVSQVRVTGLASWTDAGGGPTPIAYDFQFDPVTFQLISLWASH